MRRTELFEGLEVAYYQGPKYAGASLLHTAIEGGGNVLKGVVKTMPPRKAFGDYVVDIAVPGIAHDFSAPLRELLCPWDEFVKARDERRAALKAERAARQAEDDARESRWSLVSALFETRGIHIDYYAGRDEAVVDLETLEKLAGVGGSNSAK